MRFVPLLAALALAVPLAAAAPLAPPAPHLAAVAPVTDLLVRLDPDGNRTLLLLVEDEPGGTYAYTRASTPPLLPDVREAGTFEHAYARADGTPMLALGTYALTQSQGVLRVPLVLVENAGSAASHVVAAAQRAIGDAQEQGGFAALYATEIALPELQAYFAAAPAPSDVEGFRDYPTVYVWTARRAGPAGDVWTGAYLARTGSVELDAGGRVSRAVKDAELGAALRVDATTTRLAGAYVTETLTAKAGEPARQTMTVVAGAALADGTRAPLAAAQLEDARSGGNLGSAPAWQSTGASVGIVVDGEYVPLVGAETTQTIRPSSAGSDVERVTSVGAYVDGAYVPLVGARYHSDTAFAATVALRLALEGLGGEAGNFEVDVGAFPDGEYAPLAGLVHRATFREARHSHQSLVGIGVYSPVGFVPVAVATYDGSRPLVSWAIALANGGARHETWMLAIGTMAAGSYVPILGVEAVGEAPLGAREEQQEFRVGVFAGSYAAFVPVAAVAWDAEETPATHARAFADNGTLGGDAGEFDVRVGSYATGAWTGLAEAQYASANDGGDVAESRLVLGAHGPDGFVPLVGVDYEGDAALVPSFRSALNLGDDERARVTVGAFVAGEFTPLLAIENGPESVRVIPLP